MRIILFLLLAVSTQAATLTTGGGLTAAQAAVLAKLSVDGNDMVKASDGFAADAFRGVTNMPKLYTAEGELVLGGGSNYTTLGAPGDERIRLTASTNQLKQGTAANGWTGGAAGTPVNLDDGYAQNSLARTLASGAASDLGDARVMFSTFDTEGGASSDDLDDLGDCTQGQVLFGRLYDNAHDIVIRDSSVSGGNIQTPSDASITIGDAQDGFIAVCYGTDNWSVWLNEPNN